MPCGGEILILYFTSEIIIVTIRHILIVSLGRLIVTEIVLRRVAAAAAEQSAVFGDRDKLRGALLSEGKHYLRVESRLAKQCEGTNELRRKFWRGKCARAGGRIRGRSGLFCRPLIERTTLLY